MNLQSISIEITNHAFLVMFIVIAALQILNESLSQILPTNNVKGS
jgi:hypothetical protein